MSDKSEMDIKTYAKHARIWGLYGPEETEKYEYWCKYAENFGKNILLPMCAVGNIGAYMAKRGFNVTAFDITPEMIAEGQKRFGGIENLKYYNADIRDFNFDINPVDFCFGADFGFLLTIEDIRKALVCISRHMRKGGCLPMELWFRTLNDESDYSPPERFDLGEVLPGVKAWKIGESRNDGETGRWHLSQEVHIEENGSEEIFDHSFILQSYYREEWINALHDAGFEWENEYKNREKEVWQEDDESWFVEAIKR
ncbi:MAG: class I SAM-dependent methyltransferase [Oscillospiraceae bacterium]|nr:class I SAM-dependent methyltransferase [Oscillospiraceae bacterium]